jgi:uroporphyrinogen-III synthase
LNTYTTIPTSWTESDLQTAKETDVVTFASPSAVKVWKDRVGTSVVVVVIGSTSYHAARNAGFQQVFSPSGASKGVEPWAALTREVVKILPCS